MFSLLSLADFWWYVIVACLVWYVTVAVYVAVRGAFDIKHMFERLGRLQSSEDDAED
jgi:hypothetical protein